MATITVGAVTVTPLLVLNSDRSRDSRNVLIEPIDSPAPYVSLAESATPTQSFVALFATEADATAAFDMVSAGLPIDVVTDARSFTCVTASDSTATIERASENRARWTLTVPIREIP